MMKSVFGKTITGLCATTILVGAFTYSSQRFESQKIDLSAFRNAANNIQHITKKTEMKPDVVVVDVTGSIVKSIEKEVRGKILRSRYAMKPKKIESIVKYQVVAKNWGDIKPEFAAVDVKLDSDLLKKIASNNEAATEFEINNSDMVKLYGFEVESLQYESFANAVIASVENPAQKIITTDITELTEDAVNVAQASTTTHLVEEIASEAPAAPAVSTQEEIAASDLATKENAINDDLVVYDYSAPAKVDPNVKKMFNAPISKSVKEAIEREVHKSPKLAMNTVTTQKTSRVDTAPTEEELAAAMKFADDADNDNTPIYDYAKKPVATTVAKSSQQETADAVSAMLAPTSDMSTQAEFKITAREINLSSQKSRVASGFEFVPDYDRGDRSDDQGTGEIKIGYSLSGDANTQTGVVQIRGVIPTRVELNLLNGGMDVPLLSEVGIQKFLEKNKTDVSGNLLMVATNPSIVDVEVDSQYAVKLFFSSKFKMLESRENASYILFMGVKTGSIAMRYLLDNKETAQKDIYVGEGEMYFEDPEFIASERELYTLTTRSLLGRKVKELNIDGSNISVFGTKTNAKKKAINAYEVKIPELVKNSRKYLEFKHLGNSFYVGTQGTREIEIPGQDFINRVLQANEISELGAGCMVQMNLTKDKDLRDIKVNGKNKSGEMFVETSFLDNDGNFSRDNSELSEKVFVSGDQEGLFNIRLDYTDGSTDFLKTFCSEGSYLIEQL